MSRARDLADSADKDIAGTLTLDGLIVDKEGTDHLKITDTSSSNTLTLGVGNTVGAISVDPTNSVASSDFDIEIDGNRAIRVAEGGDIIFYDSDENTSFVYDESAGSTFNENGDDKDFRVESASNTHALFVDAGNSRVAIGTSSVSDDFTVRNRFNVSENDGGSEVTLAGVTNRSASLFFKEGSTQRGRITGVSGSNTLTFQAGTSERLRMNDTEVVFNDASADIDFRVESDTNTHALFVDAGTSMVGINRTPSDAFLHIQGDFESDYALKFYNTKGNDQEWGFRSHGVNGELFAFYDISDNKQMLAFSSSGTEGVIINEDSNDMDFRVESDGNTHMLFVDAGNNAVLIGKSDTSDTVTGINFQPTEIESYSFTHNHSGGWPVMINRQSSDGTLLDFRQANISEGYISVSGSTVSYNGFAGRHESSGIPTTTARGTVVSTIDELDEYLSGTKQGQTRADHAKVEVSDSVGDPCVYGVVDDFTDDGSVNVVSVGIAAVRVTGACAKGDLLESNGDGTAKVQSDDIVRSKTLGKVTIGNSDTGVKLVSCVMYCG